MGQNMYSKTLCKGEAQVQASKYVRTEFESDAIAKAWIKPLKNVAPSILSFSRAFAI